MEKLCSIKDIPEDNALGCELRDGTQVFVLKWQGKYHAYINSCPHAGWPLNIQPNSFFDLERQRIQCSNHMAMFDPETGLCTAGPCNGDELTRLNIRLIDEKIYADTKPENGSAADYI